MAKISYKFPAEKFKEYIEVAKMESVTVILKDKGKDKAPIQMGNTVFATLSFRDPAYIGYMERAFAQYEKNKVVKVDQHPIAIGSKDKKK